MNIYLLMTGVTRGDCVGIHASWEDAEAAARSLWPGCSIEHQEWASEYEREVVNTFDEVEARIQKVRLSKRLSGRLLLRGLGL